MKTKGTSTNVPPAADRRRHSRIVGPDDAQGSLRLRGGETLKLLNMSAGGALVESTRRLLPGHRYALQWTSGETVQAVRGEVTRARVGRLHGDSGLAYEVALLFDERVRPGSFPGAA